MGRFYLRIPAPGGQTRWQLVSEHLSGPKYTDPGLLKLRVGDIWHQHEDKTVEDRKELNAKSPRQWEQCCWMGLGKPELLKSFDPFPNAGYFIGYAKGWRPEDQQPGFGAISKGVTSVYGAASRKMWDAAEGQRGYWRDSRSASYAFFNYEFIRLNYPTVGTLLFSARLRVIYRVTCSMMGSEILRFPPGDARFMNAYLLNATEDVSLVDTGNVTVATSSGSFESIKNYAVRDVLYPLPYGYPLEVRPASDGDLHMGSVTLNSFAGTFLYEQDIDLAEIEDPANLGLVLGVAVDEMPWFGAAPNNGGYSSYYVDWSMNAQIIDAKIDFIGARN